MKTLLDQAADPKLSARRLRSLVERGDCDVRAAVASNPSTPRELLLRLLGEFPIEVLENPAMALYQLADPALFLHADPALQADWVRHPATPAWLLEQLGASEDLAVRAGLACHPSSPLSLIERLAFPGDFGDHEVEPCAEAMHHPLLTTSLLFDMAVAFDCNGFDPDLDDPLPAGVADLLLLPPDADLSPETGEASVDDLWSVALSLDDEGDVADEEGWASLTFRDPGTGAYRMARLDEGRCCGDDDGALEDEARTAPRAAVGGDELASVWGSSPEELVCHPGAPWHLVRRWMHHYEGALDDAIGRLDVPVEQLARLASAPAPVLRRAVAAHPSTPASALAALAHAPEPMIRLTVARHRATPADALEALAGDESATIRRAVAGNRSTPDEVRRRLADDRRASVRQAAQGEDGEDEE